MVHSSKHWKNCTSIQPFIFYLLLLSSLLLFFYLSFLLIVRYLFASRVVWISSCGTSFETLEELYLDPLRLHHRLPFLSFPSFSYLKIHLPLSYNVACLWIQFYFEFKSNSNPHISNHFLTSAQTRTQREHLTTPRVLVSHVMETE